MKTLPLLKSYSGKSQNQTIINFFGEAENLPVKIKIQAEMVWFWVATIDRFLKAEKYSYKLC